ncbi:MAG: YggT family protein [bacterium]
MNTLGEAGLYLVQTIGHLYLTVLVLRFLLQAVRADFNNPISRFLIRATHQPTQPIRKLVPTYRTFDMATLLLALVWQILIIQLSAFVAGYSLLPVLYMIAWAVIGTLSLVLYIYLYGLLIVIVASWVAPHSRHPALMLLSQMMAPVMAPFQRLIPALGGLDLSPILVFLVINMLRIFLAGAAQQLRLPQGLVPGI